MSSMKGLIPPLISNNMPFPHFTYLPISRRKFDPLLSPFPKPIFFQKKKELLTQNPTSLPLCFKRKITVS